MPDSEPDFPGTREYIGTIQKADASTFKVYIPIMADIASLDLREPNFQYRLAAKSIGISYYEFLTWGFADGLLVTKELNRAVDILTGVGDKK